MEKLTYEEWKNSYIKELSQDIKDDFKASHGEDIEPQLKEILKNEYELYLNNDYYGRV